MTFRVEIADKRLTSWVQEIIWKGAIHDENRPIFTSDVLWWKNGHPPCASLWVWSKSGHLSWYFHNVHKQCPVHFLTWPTAGILLDTVRCFQSCWYLLIETIETSVQKKPGKSCWSSHASSTQMPLKFTPIPLVAGEIPANPSISWE